MLGIMNGTLSTASSDRAINYWWGLDSGVIDVQLSDQLPEGVRYMAEVLKKGIMKGQISPFGAKIYDQNGILRCDGENELSAEKIMEMDWFCDNVDGQLPALEDVLPHSLDMVKLLGLPHLDDKSEREELTQ